MNSLTIILAESALEPIPDELLNNYPSTRLDKKNKKTLLDKSFHSHLMEGLVDREKRGRPDIVHMSVMSITSTPLYLEKKIKLYIHTSSNCVFDIGLGVRLPKSYHRFTGLFEQLFSHSSQNKNLSSLITLNDSSFSELVSPVNSNYVVAFSRHGTHITSKDITDKLIHSKNPVLVVGGFSHGTMSKQVLDSVDATYSIGNYKLESHTVCSRMIYELEKVPGIL